MSVIDTCIKKTEDNRTLLKDLLETLNDDQITYIYCLVSKLFGGNQSSSTKL